MKPFIKVFSVGNGNGVFLFAVDIKVPGNPRKRVQDLFLPPKKCTREKPKDDDTVDGTDNEDYNNGSDILPGDIAPVFMKGVD